MKIVMENLTGTLAGNAADKPQKPAINLRRGEGGNELSLYLTSDIQLPSYYSEAVSHIVRLNENDTLKCYIHTDGGYVMTAQYLGNVIANSPANSIGYAYGKVISAGTLILAAFKKVVISPNAVFMFHGFRGGIAGKSSTMSSYAETQMAFQRHLYQTMVDKNLITSDEYTRLLDGGEDIYVSGREMITRCGSGEVTI